MKITTVPQGNLLGACIQAFLFHKCIIHQSKYRPIKKLRRLAHVPVPVVNKSLVPKVKAHCQRAQLKQAARVIYPLASETVKDVAEMIKGLDVKDPFKANRETSFPREDYTPYVTYVDCRDQGGPCPGSPRG